ncbi:MAG: hypothetical protein ACOYN0_05315 [Phycisphaerales bacterium]
MLKPATLYFALTFAAGFVLGTVRVLFVAPRVGEVAAVLIECPLILVASFLVARWVLHRFAPRAGAGRRLLIGVAAFAMLMTAEMGMTLLRGTSPRGFLASLFTTQGLVGLGAQVLFAFMPLLIGSRASARP